MVSSYIYYHAARDSSDWGLKGVFLSLFFAISFIVTGPMIVKTIIKHEFKSNMPIAFAYGFGAIIFYLGIPALIYMAKDYTIYLTKIN